MSDSFFRPEVLKHRQHNSFGKILLIPPLTGIVLTLFMVAIGIVLVVYLVWGSYTRKERVQGVLIPDLGLIKVHAPQTGILLNSVREGQSVRRGQMLFRLVSDHSTVNVNETQRAVGEQLEERKRSVEFELRRQRELNQAAAIQAKQRISSLTQEIAQLDNEQQVRDEQVRLAESGLQQHHELARQGFVSTMQLQQKRDGYLEQLAKRKELERLRTGLQRELTSAREALLDGRVKGDNQNAVLERNLSSLQQDFLENEGKRELHIVAPVDGTVTAIQAMAGQTVNATAPLLNLLPDGTVLEANLYAPSRSIGFIKPGSKVLLRYQAYPYQKFGQQEGLVRTISRVALAPTELPFADPDIKEPLYKITVGLKSQTLLAYGKLEALRAGMRLEADIVMDTRKWYEWLLEPLYSISGHFPR